MSFSIPQSSLSRACLIALTSSMTAHFAQAVEITDPVIVTATRTAQASAQSLAAVTVITRDDIEHSQARDLAELLRRHAGIDVVRSGPQGQQTSVFIRGTESNHTLVMIDGVKLNAGSSGIASLQFIDPNMIERIEVVKGPRSTLYGSDAIGGVINIVTRSAREARSAAFTATMGAHNNRQVSAHVGGTEGIWRANLDAQTQDSEGFPVRTSSDIDRGYNNAAYNARLGVDLGDTDIELRRWQSVGTSEYMTTDFVTFSLVPVDQNFNNHATALEIRHDVTGNWLSKLTLSHIQDQLVQNQSDDFLDSKRKSLDWQNDFELGIHVITAGATLWREDIAVNSFGTAYDEQTDIDEYFIQDDINLGRHNILLGARYTDHEGFGDHTSWNLGYGFTLIEGTLLYVSAGTAFTAPSAGDRFGYGGNPDLQPEEAITYELGIKHKFNDATRVTLALFDTKIDDMITWRETAPFVYTPENINEARIRGVELSLNHQHGSWNAGIEAIAQSPRDETADEPLARRARRSLTGHLGYSFGDIRITGEMVAQNKRLDIPGTSTYNPGYTVANLLTEVRLSKEFTLGARIENLFDRDYILVNGFRTEERSFYMTLRFQPAL